MAADSYDPYGGYDPSQDPNYADQIRQQVMAQLGGDPSAAPADSAPVADTPSPDFNATQAAAIPQTPDWGAGLNPTVVPQGPTSDSGGALNTTPGYVPPPAPAVGANGSVSVPRPSVDPTVVYTDQHGNAYDPPALAAAFASGAVTDPRVRDILQQYGYFGPNTGPAAAQKTTSGGSSTGGGATGGAGAYGLTNGYAMPPTDTSWRDSIRQIIMNRLAADQGPVDVNAPNIMAALNAAKDQATRQNTTERDQLAERLYGQGMQNGGGGGGLNTDAINQSIQQSNERTGLGLGKLRADLIQSAYKDKMTELNHLLDLATQTGDTESAQKIQVTLANLQAQLSREGLGVNLAEFGAQLDQNAVLAGL